MKQLAALACLVSIGGCINAQPLSQAMVRASGAERSSAEVAMVQRGSAYAQAHCASCHAVGPTGESRLAPAPPFRALGLRYPVEDLAEAFAEGIVTAHPAMPEVVLSSEENADLIAYLKSIQSPAGL